MDIILPAAGFGTRLRPHTWSKPKPLVTVAGKPMMEHVLDNLATIPYIDHAYVVTNQKFVDHFQSWADDYHHPKLRFRFTIVNDGSTDDSNKLGAIGDMYLVVQKHQLDDDTIVVGGDNLFSIANYFGVSLEAVYDRNPWTRTSSLRAGQELRLPPPTR